jgi:hypothetical protein
MYIEQEIQRIQNGGKYRRKQRNRERYKQTHEGWKEGRIKDGRQVIITKMEYYSHFIGKKIMYFEPARVVARVLRSPQLHLTKQN